jgi:hypothetical protein
VYVRRSFGKGRLRCTKTETSVRAVPLQAIALAALDQLPAGSPSELLFPAVNGGYLDLHNFRNRDWKPAQLAAGIQPFRRIYDLRHTFATFALRAGISTFDLSRYMGASLTMIDRARSPKQTLNRGGGCRVRDGSRRGRRGTVRSSAAPRWVAGAFEGNAATRSSTAAPGHCGRCDEPNRTGKVAVLARPFENFTQIAQFHPHTSLAFVRLSHRLRLSQSTERE